VFDTIFLMGMEFPENRQFRLMTPTERHFSAR
jgi:hypothetical protein